MLDGQEREEPIFITRHKVHGFAQARIRIALLLIAARGDTFASHGAKRIDKKRGRHWRMIDGSGLRLIELFQQGQNDI